MHAHARRIENLGRRLDKYAAALSEKQRRKEEKEKHPIDWEGFERLWKEFDDNHPDWLEESLSPLGMVCGDTWMATNQERRIKNLERAIPKKTADFEGSFQNLDIPLDPGDPRLRCGVEEFVEFLPGNGKHEKRGRAYLNPWCMVKFWGGGKRKSWNKALALLRTDPEITDGRHGFGGSVSFSEEDGEVYRDGGLLILFCQFNRPGCRQDRTQAPEPDRRSFTFEIGDDGSENK